MIENYDGEIEQINGTDKNVHLQYAYMTLDETQCVLMNIFLNTYNGIPKDNNRKIRTTFFIGYCV